MDSKLQPVQLVFRINGEPELIMIEMISIAEIYLFKFNEKFEAIKCRYLPTRDGMRSQSDPLFKCLLIKFFNHLENAIDGI